jgi:hypothetical protein
MDFLERAETGIFRWISWAGQLLFESLEFHRKHCDIVKYILGLCLCFLVYNS